MGFSRSRTLYLLVCLALAVLSLRPVESVDRAFDVLLAPARVFAELAAPVGWLQGRRAHAGDSSGEQVREAERVRHAELERAVLDSARPADAGRLDGAGWVRAEVVRREHKNQDRIRIRVEGRAGLQKGLPVVSEDYFVGVVVDRWGRQAPDLEDGELLVELITSASARIGASVDGGELKGMRDVQGDLVVGGLAPVAGRAMLDVHNPERRDIERGSVVVNDSVELAEDHTYLANGFLLGELERVSEAGKVVTGVRPGLDYGTGLYQVLVLLPGDGPVEPPGRRKSVLADDGWRPARFFLRSELSWWREGRKLPLGRSHGIERGAAVASDARFVGRVERAGYTFSDVRMVGDPGFSFAALAMVRSAEDGDERPHVMGRIMGRGRDADGALLFEWPATLEIAGEGRVRASVWTGSGEAGVPRGLLLGDAELPCGPGPHLVRIHQPEGAREPGNLRVRIARGGGVRAMKSRWVSWLMLGVWSSWIIAVQGILVAQTGLSAWLPDAGLVLLIACVGRFQKQDVPRAALLLALSRVAYSIEPPAAIFAAFLGTAILVHAIRAALEVNGVLLRTVVGGLAGWLFPAWLLVVQHARDGGETVALFPEILGLWRVAFSTAFFALAFGPVLAHLPGLTPLRTRRW